MITKFIVAIIQIHFWCDSSVSVLHWSVYHSSLRRLQRATITNKTLSSNLSQFIFPSIHNYDFWRQRMNRKYVHVYMNTCQDILCKEVCSPAWNHNHTVCWYGSQKVKAYAPILNSFPRRQQTKLTHMWDTKSAKNTILASLGWDYPFSLLFLLTIRTQSETGLTNSDHKTNSFLTQYFPGGLIIAGPSNFLHTELFLDLSKNLRFEHL